MKTRTYVGVFAALVLLTGLTVLSAHLKLGTTVAVVIAALKASLVGLFFMHLYFEGRFTRFVALLPLAFFLLLLLLLLPDFVPALRV